MAVNLIIFFWLYFTDCQGVNIVPEDFVAAQLKSVLSDMQVDVVIQIIDCCNYIFLNWLISFSVSTVK